MRNKNGQTTKNEVTTILKKIIRFNKSCIEQPSNTGMQRQRYYHCLHFICDGIIRLNPLVNGFVPKVKNTDFNVPVFDDKDHGHSCLDKITESGEDTNTRNIIKQNKSTVSEVEPINNCTDTNNDGFFVTSTDNSYFNNTCILKHGTLDGPVSILSFSSEWGQPDSTLG